MTTLAGAWDEGHRAGCVYFPDCVDLGHHDGNPYVNAPDDETRGIRFRVETACDGYASLTRADVPDDVFDEDDYIDGARAAAEAIRAALTGERP